MITKEEEQERGGALWELRFGARLIEGGVMFRLWSPRAGRAGVAVCGEPARVFEMERHGEADVFEAFVPGLRAGADYFYVIDGEKRRPDPVSRLQPEGVHGPSRVVDPADFVWTDSHWKGLPLEDYLIYELHAGTFTPEGTFEAAAAKLPHLKELGVTAVELMPVAQFPGGRNWGYDGVQLFAPQSTYGGPRGLKTLVDACHREGLAVVLDVVYNHLGPEGNYLSDYAAYFSSRYWTAWGDAVNFDGETSDGVRRFFIDNALYWLTEYHIDALRLDAVHDIYDRGPRHFLAELGEEFRQQAARLGRAAWTIAESDLNDVRVINPVALCGYGLDAQWSDDFHHSLHALLTKTRRGYFADFGRISDLSKAVAEGFTNDGRVSVHRRKRHGTSSRTQPGRQFVTFIQNHDQIANSYWGERLSAVMTHEQQKLAAALLLCAPNVPMLFMGQEYGETAPFYYFTSHGDAALIESVRRGRYEEYAPYAAGREYADPQAPATFEQSKLAWEKLDESPHAELLRLYRDLIAHRKWNRCLCNCDKSLTFVEHDEDAGWLTLRRGDASGASALLLCNFSGAAQLVTTIHDAAAGDWRLALWTGDAAYGGRSDADGPTPVLTREELNRTGVRLAGWSAALYILAVERM